VERDGLAERKRQDQEKAEVNRARQLRQGHVSVESEQESEQKSEQGSTEEKTSQPQPT
jgi:hypothetical protein